MKRLDEFAEDARMAGLRLKVDPERLDTITRLNDDGLFHVPMLALCILVVARAKKEPLATADIAVWTGATLGRYFSSIEASRNKLEWSVPHRRRCADALVFLESVELVKVEDTLGRVVICTPKGTEFVRSLLARADEVGLISRGLNRSYREVEHHGLDLL